MTTAENFAAMPDDSAELLEALEGLVSDQHGHGTACGCPWCKARAAIAKARARSEGGV